MENYQNNILIAIGLNSTILTVWFLTNAFFEYFKYLNFIFKDYNEEIKKQYIYFTDFLSKKQDFLSKLFSCPFCIGLWSSAIISICILNIWFTGVIYIASLLIFFSMKKLCCS